MEASAPVPTILVVDDTPANLEWLEIILKSADYAVRSLPNGMLGLQSALTEPPDLILLDIKMPGMDGYEVCVQLKADPRTREIPVIFISALRETEDKVRAFAVGGVDYVGKPFEAEEVLARVDTHLRLRALQTGLSAAKERAEAANRAKSTFLANMSHELRTPLNAVLGFAQLIAMDTGLSGKNRGHLDAIRQSGGFLLELINDMLDLAKIEAGRFECRAESWDTQTFFKDLSMMFSARAESQDLFFHYRESPPLPPVLHSDPRRLRQIAVNLLGNALKFTRQGGIVLHTGFNENKLFLEVTDTGPGIPAEMLEKIFEPFEQAGDSMQKNRGTGLGLSITRRLAEMMDGTVTVSSTVGTGSTFRAEVSAQAMAAASVVHLDSVHAPAVTGYRRSDGGEPVRILVCDDVTNNREPLAGILRGLGFVVLEAENGGQCLDIARHDRPDAVLVDLYMPEADGFEMVHALRELPEFQNTPVIAVSADAFAETREHSLAAGCDDYLAKPVEMGPLTETLGKLLPLAWEYAESPRSIAVDAEEIDRLPAAQAERMLEALRHGDIRAVMEAAETLEQTGCCPSLARRISELAHDIRLDEITHLLESRLRRNK